MGYLLSPLTGNAVKSFPIEYPAVLALATDFVTSVASAKTAGTPDNMCLKPFTALPNGQRRERFPRSKPCAVGPRPDSAEGMKFISHGCQPVVGETKP